MPTRARRYMVQLRTFGGKVSVTHCWHKEARTQMYNQQHLFHIRQYRSRARIAATTTSHRVRLNILSDGL
jgi:hypothetical protein